MKIDYYMNMETGEVTEDRDEAIAWFRSKVNIGVYAKGECKTTWEW